VVGERKEVYHDGHQGHDGRTFRRKDWPGQIKKGYPPQVGDNCNFGPDMGVVSEERLRNNLYHPFAPGRPVDNLVGKVQNSSGRRCHRIILAHMF
jgi:hypothetical protein